ncbi:transmembrane protein 272-like [Xyrichtys novacula]|uniref:Transmembrane protein 272-like n=1 Tax=Xyrichtys novacula TaxID=13765 RepID=A0AAV1HP77_XYRNO|nr:transmembrane protein 272-like [Xyrichtys novacula]
MAAPSTGRPVSITVAAVWRLEVKPPPRPPKLTVAATIGWSVLTLAQVILGVVYFKECPQQPVIPQYLLALALTQLLMIPFVTLSCESDEAHPQQHPKGVKACLQTLNIFFRIAWVLAGDVWILSVYQPNYDPAAGDGLYCNKNLYTFAFWYAMWETFLFWLFLTKLCRGFLCGVMMSPPPTNNDFYRNV